MDLALNNLQRLICNKRQTNKNSNNISHGKKSMKYIMIVEYGEDRTSVKLGFFL